MQSGERSTAKQRLRGCYFRRRLLADAEELGHFTVEKALPRTVRLDPLSVEDELRDGSLAHVPHNFFGGAGVALNVDLGIGDPVFFEEALGFAAIAAPRSGINQNIHLFIIMPRREPGKECCRPEEQEIWGDPEC
jgi:hypothetical protein